MIRGWTRNPLCIILVLTLLQLFIALLTNGFAMSSDEATWHYIGRNWFRNGLVPYSGGVDNKSPLFFAVFGLSDTLFGVNYWFPRVFGTICQSIGIFYLYKIADHIAGKRAGMLAISFYGLSVLWHGADGRYVSYTETYDVLFTILSFYFFLKAQSGKGFFISGFLAAVAVAFRLSAFFSIAAMLLASLRQKRGYTLAYIPGVLSGLFSLGLMGILAGINLHDVYIYGFADNFGRASTTDHDLLWRSVQFHTMFFYSEVILFYPLVLAYLFIKRRIDWLLLWLILVFAGINALGNYARVDLKELLPAMSLVGAFALDYLIQKYQLPAKQIMLIIWLCFSPKIVEPFLNFTRLFTGEFQFAKNFCHEPYILPDESAGRQLGLWVKANTLPQEMVFVAGGGQQVQVYSERVSPGIYFSVTQTAIAKKRFFEDMKRNRAAMILVPLFPEYRQTVDDDLKTYIDELVAKDYYFVTCMFNYNVYRMRK